MWLYYFYCTDEDNEVDMEHLFLTNYPYWLGKAQFHYSTIFRGFFFTLP